jgi:hypothetical protein
VAWWIIGAAGGRASSGRNPQEDKGLARSAHDTEKVISPQAHRATIQLWLFFDFVDPSDGRNKIEQWLIGWPARRAGLDSALGHLRGLRRDQWARVHTFDWLVKKKRYVEAGLGEVRFEIDRLPHRIAGYFPEQQPGRFVLLMACHKRTPGYRGEREEDYYPYPPPPFDVAADRRDIHSSNPESVEQREVP